MNRRKTSDIASKLAVPIAGPARALGASRALVVAGTALARDLIAAHLSGGVEDLLFAGSAGEALAGAASGAGVDVVLVHESIADAASLIERVRALRAAAACVMVCDEPSIDRAVRAMHAGAADLLPLDLPMREFRARLCAAMARVTSSLDRQAAATRRVERLRRLCRTLNSSRRELMNQVVSLCGDLNRAYADMADQLTLGAMATEFNALIRQDLDIESLLRTVLEYLLPKTGPTNAAVFLPSSSGDFSLGAYVNYDRSKDSAEMLFDQLAATLAPAFECEEDAIVLAGPDALAARLGAEADWLGDANLAVFSCREEGECLGVVALFRDRQHPFPESLRPVLTTIRDLFAKQLGRVIRTHHRHLPKHKWGLLGDEGTDDLDLAA